MNGNKLSILVLLLMGSYFSGLTQTTKAQLQKEKQNNLKKIKETEQILSETTREKKNSLGELSALTQRIRQQEKVIQSNQTEIMYLEMDINQNNDLINNLKADLKKLKAEYAKMLFAAQKVNGKADRLALLFSAKTFDQLLMRIKYMEQYSKARKTQAQAIIRVQTMVQEQVRVSEEKHEEMAALLREEVRERDRLGAMKLKQKELIVQLKKQEGSLLEELQQTKLAIARLDAAITKIVREEIERAQREEREREARNQNQSGPKTTKSTPHLSPEMVALSNVFAENKHKFPWPVNGFVSQHYGKQPHPVLSGIVIQSDGINIQTTQDELVKAVFDGVVSRIAEYPLLGQTVIIKHGEYFTIYTCMQNLTVHSGEKVKRGQPLGNVILNSQGVSELRFQLWQNFDKLNPEDWLQQ